MHLSTGRERETQRKHKRLSLNSVMSRYQPVQEPWLLRLHGQKHQRGRGTVGGDRRGVRQGTILYFRWNSEMSMNFCYWNVNSCNYFYYFFTTSSAKHLILVFLFCFFLQLQALNRIFLFQIVSSYTWKQNIFVSVSIFILCCFWCFAETVYCLLWKMEWTSAAGHTYFLLTSCSWGVCLGGGEKDPVNTWETQCRNQWVVLLWCNLCV